ncbi:hypothetical protein PM082_017887 [Marasmius tenuissimus]|nr:hypothetical protein PM082_017887 [Marasmius tenuissimus]
MPLPPDATSNWLFSYLDPQDIIYYSRTCREAYQQAKMYWIRALCIYRLLSRFFTEDEVRQFRVVQAQTGTLISGSTALQFFNRVAYLDSDLDLYVEHCYCKPVASFLRRIGYKYEPRGTQNPSLSMEIMYRSDDLRHGIGTPYDDEPQNQSERGFAGVFNMIRGRRKVQLITAKYSAMDIILNFHSTVVMNVITYSHAYSLYPEATFQKSLSLICYQCDGVKSTAPVQKYMRRGWRMISYDGIEYVPSTNTLQPGEALPGDHEKMFRHKRMRHLGDSCCWTYKLPDIPVTIPPETLYSSTIEPGEQFSPGLERRLLAIQSALESLGQYTRLTCLSRLAREEIQTGLQAIESNSWALDRGSDGLGDMNFTLLCKSQLLYMYCIDSEWKLGEDPKAPRSWSGQRATVSKTVYFNGESDDLLLRALVKQRAS